MIFIHIGLQKTGTTSLQLLLDRENLLRFPIDPIQKNNQNSKLFYSSGNR